MMMSAPTIPKGWNALMRRNFIYRKRNWVSTIAELALPVLFCFVLVSLKETAEKSEHFKPREIPAHFPSDIQAIQILSFTDYITALQAKRICLAKNRNTTVPNNNDDVKTKRNHSNFVISGMLDHGRNWQVPFIQCDSRHCKHHGEEAYRYCHYPKLGLAASTPTDLGGMQRARDFQTYVYKRYPQLHNTSLPALKSSGNFTRFFESSQALDDYIQHPGYGIGVERAKLAMAIVFTGNDTTNYDYAIRVNSTNNNAPEYSGKGSNTWRTTPDTNRMFASLAKRETQACRFLGQPQGPLEYSCTGQYILNGLLTTQRFVQDWIMVDTGAHDAGLFVAEHGVKFAPFPSKAYQEQGFYTVLNGFLALFLTLGFLYPVASIISYIATERETGQKEFLKMMSVKEWEIGTSWFCTFLLLHMVTAKLLTRISRPLFAYSDPMLLWTFWQSALVSFVAFACFVPSLVVAKTNSASRTVLVGLLLFLSGYFLSQSIDLEDGDPFWMKVLCLHPGAAFAYGVQRLGRLEDAGIGTNWNSIDSSDSPSGFTVFVSLQFLWLDCLLYTLLSWYFNRVFPGTEHGNALPYSFPLRPAYWFRCFQTQQLTNQAPFEYTPANNDEESEIPMEPVSESLRQQSQMGSSVELHNLRKVFPNCLGNNSVTAVDGLNLSLYQGQVTALLGHNGSGKSTTIKMLTGAIVPTDGFHVVAGKRSTTQMEGIRETLGICLQNNDALFPKLTVQEHLCFYSRLKGVSSKTEEVDRALKDVGLDEKRHTLSMHLSGGMKRKLCVGIAFCGDSRLVVLDEPTSGMDPFSRRFTWNLIQRYRPGKIILLTTHFLDEADLLADKIAILADGRLQCVGSPLWLKRQYDVGYRLTIAKDAGNSPLLGNDQKVRDDKLIEMVHRVVTGSRTLSISEKELTFHLPLSSTGSFGTMFRYLDTEVNQGVLVSYGIGMTTLDEVFREVARGTKMRCSEDDEDAPSGPNRKENWFPTSLQASSTISPKGNNTRSHTFWRHLHALLCKRLINFRRDKKAWFATTILPGLFVLFGFLVLKYGDTQKALGPLRLDLTSYNQEDQLIAPIGTQNPVPFNSPGRDFRCQPGWCSYQYPISKVKETDEMYFFCGGQSYLLSSPNCSIDVSSTIMGRLNNSEITPIGSNVGNINESSHSILRSAPGFKDSQYGAIWFTHQANSTLDGGGGSYGEKAAGRCHAMTREYMMDTECDLYKGLGYVISYNFTAIHVAPLFQKLADEAIIREAINTDELRISPTIHPLPKTQLESRFRKEDDVFSLWFMVVLSFPIIAGYMANFVLVERESKVKHLQTLAGVEPATYWLSSILWDTMNYQLPLWFTVSLMYVFDVEVFTTLERDTRGGVISLLFLFGPAAASFAYCVSFLFTSASLCNMFIITTGFITGLGGPIATYTLRLLGSDPDDPWEKLIKIARALEWTLRCTPSFCLGKGLFYTINIGTFQMQRADAITVWDGSILFYEVIALVLQSFVYLLLAICLDRAQRSQNLSLYCGQFWSFLTCNVRRRYEVCSTSDDTVEDSDALEEEDRILSDRTAEDSMVLRRLSKVYGNGKVAVDNMSLGILPGQVFGLLGVNGAGKTTTMCMLSAEFAPTSGDILLAGQTVTSDIRQLRRKLGYCAQFDALCENLTGREHVELYAALKCMDSSIIKDAADKMLSEVGFSDFDKDRLSRYYSGGMQRKLSIAIAMIGDPIVVLLDEPTTGVCPVSRQAIWRIISNLASKTSVVLTTHSMDECEALCSRIGIMSNGRLVCLGSAHHLKSKFGSGLYQLEMKVHSVEESDSDFASIYDKLSLIKEASNVDIEAVQLRDGNGIFFDLQEAYEALDAITMDGHLSMRLAPDNSETSAVYNEARSLAGVSLWSLASFAATELRIRQIHQFMCNSFQGAAQRERQDLKLRYEIRASIPLADLFSTIEEHKETLCLSEYGVSQTSLEQVFNMIARDQQHCQ